MGTVKLSAIDSQVYRKLGNITPKQLDAVVEQQERDHVITGMKADLSISHQNQLIQKTTITINGNTCDYPMPVGFGNAVYAEWTQQGWSGWGPVDLVNFDTIAQRRRKGYPAISFYGGSSAGTGVTSPGTIMARVSWLPVTTQVQVDVWYNNSQLPAKIATTPQPFQDIFVPKIVTDISVNCLPHADMPDSKRQVLGLTLDAEKLVWGERWNALMFRAPAQNDISIVPYLADYGGWQSGVYGGGYRS